jgi:hypothetical protein
VPRATTAAVNRVRKLNTPLHPAATVIMVTGHMLEDFKESITVIKTDGRRIDGVRVIFDATSKPPKVYFDDDKVLIEENDEFLRPIPNGTTEEWTVVDPGYIHVNSRLISGIQSHYQAQVRRKSASSRKSLSGRTVVNIHGGIHGSNVNAGSGTQSVSQTVKGQPTGTALAALREEVDGLHDVYLGTRKQLAEFDERQADIVEVLKAVVDRMQLELKDEPEVTPDQLRLAAENAGRELVAAEKVDAGMFRRVFGHTITQNVASSVVFEVIKGLLTALGG